MASLLNNLVELQSIENRLRAAKSQLSRCRRTVLFQENQVRNLQSQHDAKLEEIKLTKVQSDRLELELKSREEVVAKYRTALNTAKTNKEYSTILTAMNTSKADNSKLESQVLELMKNIEADQALCEQLNEQIEEQKNRLEEVRKESEVKAQKFEQSIANIQVEWDKAATEIPTEALDLFKRIADTYDGEAIAFAEKLDHRTENYSCGGCFMGLTLEIVNALMLKDEIISCPNCTRIIVLAKEEEK